MLRVAAVSAQLRKTAFQENVNLTLYLQNIATLFPKLLCSRLCANCTFRPMFGVSRQNIPTCKDLLVSIDVLLGALSFQPDRLLQRMLFLRNLVSQCAAHRSLSSTTMKKSKTIFKGQQRGLCFASMCPHPLKVTADPSHRLPEVRRFSEKFQTSLLQVFPQATRLSNFTFPCGIDCTHLFTSKNHALQVDVVTSIFGVVSIVASSLSLLAFGLNRRKITAAPLKLTVVLTGIALFTSVCLTIANIPRVQKRIACHGDGTLRLNEPTAFNGCAFISAVVLFGALSSAFIFVGVSHAWYALVGKLERQKMSQASLRRARRISIVGGYTVGSFVLAAILTGWGLSRKDIAGRLVTSGCAIGHKTVLYFMTIPFCCVALLALSFLTAGLIKLRRLANKTRLFSKSLPSRAGRAAGRHKRKRKSNTSYVLRQQVFRFLFYIVSFIALLLVHIIGQALYYDDADRLSSGFQEHLRCLFLSCNPKLDCKAIPQARLGYTIIPSISLYLSLILMCSWALEWRYWKDHWPFSVIGKHLYRLQSRSGGSSNGQSSQMNSMQSPTQERQVSAINDSSV